MDDEFMLSFFSFRHLPAHLQTVSAPFQEQALRIMALPANRMRTIALEDLIRSKDAAVRCLLAGPAATTGERVAQLIAHRACGNEEADVPGKIPGFCAVCLVPWPCAYAGSPPAAPPAERVASSQTPTANLRPRPSDSDVAWPEGAENLEGFPGLRVIGKVAGIPVATLAHTAPTDTPLLLQLGRIARGELGPKMIDENAARSLLEEFDRYRSPAMMMPAESSGGAP